MRVTVKRMREAVAGWLEEESATQEQTLQLLDAVYAGAINGTVYAGRRDFNNDRGSVLKGVREVERSSDVEYQTVKDCRCLLGTLEKIQDDNGEGGTHADITGITEEAFALAKKIPAGATPSTSPWARAAAAGIVDYYAAQGWQ